MMTVDGLKVTRPLHFLDFGDPLHDQLVSGWAAYIKRVPDAFEVRLFSDHKLFSLVGEGLYLVRVSVLDPAAGLKPETAEARLRECVIQAAPSSQGEKLIALMKPFLRQVHCALEADTRWLRALLPARLLLRGLHLQGDEWLPVDEATVAALLNPLEHGRPGLPQSGEWTPDALQNLKALTGTHRLQSTDHNTAEEVWGERTSDLEDALRTRARIVEVEAADAEALASLELEDARRRLEATRARGNPGQISRASSIHALSQDQLKLTRAVWAERTRWLTGLCATVLEISPEEHRNVLIRVKKVP
jgi:hypothetical protein